MPWHIDNNKSGCSGFAVVKDSDGSIAGCHKTEDKAKAQLAALYASERTMEIINENIPAVCQCEERTEEQRASVLHDSNSGPFTVFRQLFWGEVIERGLHVCTTGGYTNHARAGAVLDRAFPDAQTVLSGGYHMWYTKATDGEENVYRYITLSPDGHWDAEVSAKDAKQADANIRALINFLPSSTNEIERGTTRVRFWNQTVFGPRTRVRKLETPQWEDINKNYPSAVRSDIEALMATDRNAGLAVWHGEPGGGKTYAIRSLVETWQDRFDIDYVIDPDEFFGDASYMVTTLLDNGERTRLLIIEDAGEFIREDARGAGLSRLLNVADGLVGQGMRTLILLTTNERMEHLHPALVREGRCISNIEFGRFDADEASEWLGSTVDRDMTLAELYAARSAMEATMTERNDDDTTQVSEEDPTVLEGTVAGANSTNSSDEEVVPAETGTEAERSLEMGDVEVQAGDARAQVGSDSFPSTDSTPKTDSSKEEKEFKPFTSPKSDTSDEGEDDKEKKSSSILNVPAITKRDAEAIRVDHRNLPDEVADRLHDADLDVGVVDRAGRGMFETRFKPELRENEDGTIAIHGYATVYGHRYDVAGGAPFGFAETIVRGAADRSVQERSDVRLLVNHDGIALARTRSGTLRLESDEIGLYIEAPSLDPASPAVQSLASAMRRGDMDEMSFAFRVVNESWNDDYTEREISEVMLYDVSVVTYPANPAAVAVMRDGKPTERVQPAAGMSLEVAQWLAEEL